MKFYTEFNGEILGFDTFKGYLMFMLGRICGFFAFFGLLDIFFFIVYLSGYSETPFPIMKITFLIIQLFM